MSPLQTPITYTYVGLQVKFVTFSHFDKNRVVSVNFSEYLVYYKVSSKSAQSQFELFHAVDGRTDTTKLTDAFRTCFAKLSHEDHVSKEYHVCVRPTSINYKYTYGA